MFESLQENLQLALKSLRGKGKLTEANMRDGLRLVEQSLLDADVSYSVVKDFMAGVTEQALGQKVLLSLDPSHQLLGIVKFIDLSAFVFVAAGKTGPFSCGQKRQRTEPDSIRLNGKGIQIGH